MENRAQWNKIGIFNTISTLLISFFAILIAIYFLNNRFSVSIKETTENSTSQVIDTVSDNIDDYIREMNDVANRISNNIDKYLNSSSSTDVSVNYSLRSDIESIMIVNSAGDLLFHSSDYELKDELNIQNQEWFQAITPGSNLYHLTTPHVQELYKDNHSWVISLSKGTTWYEEDKGHQFGIIVVDLNVENIRKLSSRKLGDNGYIFITDENNEVVYHPQQQTIYAGVENKVFKLSSSLVNDKDILTIGSEEFHVIKNKLRNIDWYVIGVTPVVDLFTYDTQIISFIRKLVLIVVFIVIILSSVSSIFITKPIYELINVMSKVNEHELPNYSEVKGFYEVENLSISYNKMINRIEDLMSRIIKNQQELRMAEMRVLHNQINPHFLYNTLGSIMWLAEINNNEKVIQMIESLANFFRLSLAQGKETVLVVDEIKHVENYMKIQEIRYANQFKYEINVSDDIDDLVSLKFILQPIVENSILHGFGETTKDGLIQINVNTTSKQLIFEVIDNGCGVSEDKLRELNAGTYENQQNGIGINNVKQRIKIMYGSNYGLLINSELEKGTKVIVNLPLLYKEDLA